MITTQPNLMKQSLYQRHELELPACCPVSGNPQAGSRIEISYLADSTFLEVYSLHTYIKSYQGGRGEIRDMEGMIQTIANDCAKTLGVSVRVKALVNLQLGDKTTIICKAKP